MPDLLIRSARERETEEIVSLWRASSLITPHNDPYEDIRFCRESKHGEVLLGVLSDRIVASAMVGHDGHHGWIYYVAVHPDARGSNFERQVFEAAEAWLKVRGVPKVQVMTQRAKTEIRDGYSNLKILPISL